MKYYTNVYRDAEGRGFFDRIFHTSESAKARKAKLSESSKLEHTATLAIVVLSDPPDVSHELIKTALINAAIPPGTPDGESLDEDFYEEYLRLRDSSPATSKSSMTYRDKFVIHAVPHQLEETGEWVARVTIVSDRGADTRVDQYTSREPPSDNQDEAMLQSFAFGKRIIDEELGEGR